MNLRGLDADVFLGQSNAVRLEQVDELLPSLLAECRLVLKYPLLQYLLLPQCRSRRRMFEVDFRPIHKVLLELVPVRAEDFGIEELEYAEVVSLTNLLWSTSQDEPAFDPAEARHCA